MEYNKIVITSAVRTAVGTLGKALKNIPAESLGSSVISAALKKSELKLEEIFMKSNEKIMVNNLTGKFSIFGKNSNMKTDSIYIVGQKIEGFFSTNSEEKEIIKLNVYDDNISFVQNDDTDMYAKKIIYDKKTSIIELFDDVKVVRGKEIVTGDYGTLDTSDNSYKVKSNNTKKVKVIISNENE